MTDELKPKPKRAPRKIPQKYNPEWKDSTRNQRQRTRYERQTKKAAEYGFTSWAALVTAILNDEVRIVIVQPYE